MSLGHADRYFIFNVWNAALSSAASSLPSLLVSTLSNIGANVDEALAFCLSTKPSPFVSSLASVSAVGSIGGPALCGLLSVEGCVCGCVCAIAMPLTKVVALSASNKVGLVMVTPMSGAWGLSQL